MPAKPVNKMKEDNMKIHTTDNIELHYSTFGKKNNIPVVLIHGLGADRYMWQPQIESLPGEGLFLIVPDMPGHGNSSKVNTFSIKDCARYISELLDHLDCPRAVIAGVSMGGVIAQQFACNFPDKTEKLIVTDSFSEVASLSEKMAGWMQWLTMKFSPGLLLKLMEKVYKEPEMEGTLNYFRDSMRNTDTKQILKARAGLNQFNIRERLKEINIPTLVLVGNGFGNFVAWKHPAILAYYQGTDPGSFFAQLANVAKETPGLYGLQAFRALLWLVITLPVISMLRHKKWAGALLTGLFVSLPMNIPHIIPNPYMPADVRAVHFTETVISTFIFGVILFWLFFSSGRYNQLIYKS